MHPSVSLQPLPKPSRKSRPTGYHLVILGDATSPPRRRYLSRTYLHGLALAGGLLLSVLAGLGVAVTYQSHQATARHAEVISLQDERDRLSELLARQEDRFNELALQARDLSQRVHQLEELARQVDAIVRAHPEVLPDGARIDLALSAPAARQDLPAGGALATDELISWTGTTLTAASQAATTQTERLIQLRDGLEEKVYRLQHTPSIWPADGWLSSDFGYRDHPVTGKREHHDGVDIAAPQGTPVVATAAGTVIRAGWVQGYGLLVEIDHGFGVRTLYGHNQRILVKRGEEVTKGQQIALMGSTGVSTGPHVHYEVRINGRPTSPWTYLP